jgi:DNA-binding IclR family transcriptional regulator
MSSTSVARHVPEKLSAGAGVKSAMRTVEILEYFATISQPVRTCEISSALDIPNSSVDDILRTLTTRGYVSFNRRTKRYAPSYKIVCMAQAIERGFFGDDRLRLLLRELQRVTGETVYLSVQNDCWVEGVATIPGTSVEGLATIPGNLVEGVVASPGSWSEGAATIPGSWVEISHDDDYRRQVVFFDGTRWRPGTNFAAALLAFQSKMDIIDLVMRTQKMGISPNARFAVNELIDDARMIRARGFATCRRDDNVKIESVACPIRITNGNFPAAVGIVGNDLLSSERKSKELATAIHKVVTEHPRSASIC